MLLPKELIHGVSSEQKQLLHARLVLPPVIAWDGNCYSGSRLQHIDPSSALKSKGVHRVFVKKHFVAVVGASDDSARNARRLLRISWSSAISDNKLPGIRHKKTLLLRGNSAETTSADANYLSGEYRWQHPAPERSASTVNALVAPIQSGFRIVLPFGNGRAIGQELASLLNLSADQIEVIAYRAPLSEHEVAVASNVAGAAALLCMDCNAPLSLIVDVSSEATRPIYFRINGSLAADGMLKHYDLSFDQADVAPPLAWLLTETPYAITDASKTPATALIPPYNWSSCEISSTGASENVSLIAATFAQESFFDELSIQTGQDPIQYRLDHIRDDHGAQLIRSVAEAASWHPKSTKQAGGSQVMRGRGFAYATTIDQERDGSVQTWSAWVADVEYDHSSGELSVTRITAGHDIRGDRTSAEAHPTLDASQKRLLDEQARYTMAQLVAPGGSFDSWARDNQLIPTDASPQQTLPAIDLVTPHPTLNVTDVQLKAGGAFALPAAAAVANAIFDATGIRLRTAPFSGEQIKSALGAGQKLRGWGRFRKYGWVGGAAAALGASLTLAMPWRPAIAPVAPPDPNLYSTVTIERGRLVALAGDCAVCHTAPNGGVVNAGGHPLQTPFGTIYTTNITPDEKTGIGNWSFAAFERAMREGIHRDGYNLYPAFPYTAYAKMSDGDMQALYAYLMAQPPVESRVPKNDLKFPFNMRPLLSGWNLLFHRNQQFKPDPNKSVLWNRGAYLVEGAGHCSACHSPRNFLGAEKGGRHYLTGGVVDGWEAPALTSSSKAPIPWTEDELYTYLRSGFSSRHGTAAGPMAPVVAELAQLPGEDVRAMAHYIASFNPSQEPAPSTTPSTPVTTPVNPSSNSQLLSVANGKRLFQGACAACHQEGTGPTLFGVRPSLKVNTNLHSDTPDNLIHVILHGIREPANPALGYMPGFANSFNNSQMVDLLTYLRTTFASDKAIWTDLETSVQKSRQRGGH